MTLRQYKVVLAKTRAYVDKQQATYSGDCDPRSSEISDAVADAYGDVAMYIDDLINQITG